LPSTERSTLHRFWFCPHSVQMWELLRSRTSMSLNPPPEDMHSHGDFQCCLVDWFGALSGKELPVVMTTLYHLWLSRNDARDELMIEDPDRAAKRVLALSEEWSALKTAPARRGSKEAEHWCPPAIGWHKANADGGFSSAERIGGGGVIVRDHHRSPIAGACHFFP
jgi:hypothetical protein